MLSRFWRMSGFVWTPLRLDCVLALFDALCSSHLGFSARIRSVIVDHSRVHNRLNMIRRMHAPLTHVAATHWLV